MTLNVMWSIPALVAFLEPPIEAKTAVTHVPMLRPKMMNIAWSSVMRCAPEADIAIAWSIPTPAAELWMMITNMIPTMIPRKGLLMDDMMSLTASSLLKGSMESFISDIATKIKPSPAMASPMLLSFLSFTIMQKKVPKRATIGAMAPTSKAMI